MTRSTTYSVQLPLASRPSWWPRTAFPDGCVRIGWAGTRKVGLARSAISLGEAAAAACGWGQRESAAGAASRWTNSAKSSSGRVPGEPSHDPAGKAASRESASMPMLSAGTIRNKGSEVTVAATGAPGQCATSRSNADYAARGARGDPRGRNSGAGPGAENPRLPMRAEGKKRFRSATRNP